MKKAILYLSCLSTLAISSVMAGNNDKEDEDMVLVQEKFFDKTLSEARQSTKLAEDLAGELAEMKKRVAELEGQLSTSSQVPAPDDSAPSLSAYQQQLLSQWEAGRIGPRAWEELGKPNSSLSIALTPAIQETLQLYSSGEVDIFYLSSGDFTLRVGKIVNRKIFKIR